MCQLIEYQVSTLKRPVAGATGIPQLMKLIYIYRIIYSQNWQQQQQRNNLRTERSHEMAIISLDIIALWTQKKSGSVSNFFSFPFRT